MLHNSQNGFSVLDLDGWNTLGIRFCQIIHLHEIPMVFPARFKHPRIIVGDNQNHTITSLRFKKAIQIIMTCRVLNVDRQGTTVLLGAVGNAAKNASQIIVGNDSGNNNTYRIHNHLPRERNSLYCSGLRRFRDPVYGRRSALQDKLLVLM